MRSISILALGGAAGSVFRYLLQVAVGRVFPMTFPLGTFLVNVSGCFLIGILYGMSGRYTWFTMEWRLLLITGLCGGYTTFSGYSFEGLDLLRHGHYLVFTGYMGLSVLLGLGATFAGAELFK
jgi:fluoride exporter